MTKTRKFKFSKSRSKKTKNSNKVTSKNTFNKKHNVWGKIGSIYSPRKKHYLRLGTNESFNVIRDELVRDKEWYKRVKFMAKRGGVFGDKLKSLL